MNYRRIVARILVVSSCIVSAASCGNVSGLSDPQSAAEAAIKYGECTSETVELAPPLEFLLNARSWDQAVSVDGLRLDSTQSVVDRESSSIVEYAIEREGAERSDVRLRTHESFMPGIDWAIKNGADLYIAYGYDQAADNILATAVVFPGNGNPFFIGSCAERGMTAPLLAALGSDYSEFLVEMINSRLEDREGIVDEYWGVPSQLEEIVVLNPESVSTEVLDSLHSYAFAIHAGSRRLDGPGTICMKIDAGWNDCIELSQLASSPQLIAGYYGDDGLVEMWLMDKDANLTTPIQLLGTVDLARQGGADFGTPSGLVIGLVIDGSLRSAADMPVGVDDVSIEVTGVAAAEALLLDRDLAVQVVGHQIVDELTRPAPTADGEKDQESVAGN